MAVKIRLRRMGTRGKPCYRVVVADSRTPRDGRFITQLGYYDPRTEPPTLKIEEEKALLWLGRGAQPTDTARALLKKLGLIKRVVVEPKVVEVVAEPEKPVRKKKTAAPKAEPEAAAPEAAEVVEPEAAEPEAVEVAEPKAAKPKAARVAKPKAAAPKKTKAAEPKAAEPEAAIEVTEPEAVAESEVAVEPEAAVESEAAGEEQSSQEQE